MDFLTFLSQYSPALLVCALSLAVPLGICWLYERETERQPDDRLWVDAGEHARSMTRQAEVSMAVTRVKLMGQWDNRRGTPGT